MILKFICHLAAIQKVCLDLFEEAFEECYGDDVCRS